MGSYRNIHLNLFPIYVLLLLLTLSHGRPPAKVREARGKVLHSHRLPFSEKWAESSNIYPSSNLNSVSNEYNSVVYDSHPHQLSHLKSTDQQVSTVADAGRSKMGSLVEKEGATGSSEQVALEESLDAKPLRAGEESGMEWSRVSQSPVPLAPLSKHLNPQILQSLITARSHEAEATTLVQWSSAFESESRRGNDSSLGWDADVDDSSGSLHNSSDAVTTPVLSEHKYSFGEEEVAENSDGGIVSDHGAPHMRDSVAMLATAANDDEQQAVDFLAENDAAPAENNEQVGSLKQLVTFRQNILRSLGLHEAALQTNFSPTNVTLDYNDVDTLKKYNITKEEYLEAYTAYMMKVKQRRLANRGLVGVKDRRRNAVTIAKTYHDNGTDLFSIGSKVLKLFRFDIQFTPTMDGTDVRIQRVVLTMPAMCQLTGHLRNSTDLPDIQELAELSSTVSDDCVNGSTTDKEHVTHVDLTRNVTSWSFRSRTSSPFIALAICSRGDGSGDTLDATSAHHQHHVRHASHHGSSMKVVTKEFLKPTPESQLKRRTRRAAPTEPSTLSSFTHKRDSGRGRECANTRHGKTCCRRSLKIKFSDLGISDVILEPKEFDAHVCDGRCNARRVAYASTHAMFQHILHQTKGKKFAPRPCCVPTALGELDVLHLDPNGNRNGGPKLILTILKDAIVKECGCS